MYNQPWATPRRGTFFKIEGTGSLLSLPEPNSVYWADFKASLTASSSSWSRKPNSFQPYEENGGANLKSEF